MAKQSRTDWSRVQREYAEDTPIPVNHEDELYDPNDEAEVDAFLRSAIVTHGIKGGQHDE